jgi:hypothetical protein
MIENELKKKKLNNEVKTEIKSPFSGQPMDPFGMGSSPLRTQQSGFMQKPVDDDYCTCTRCPHCGKKLRRSGPEPMRF